MRNILSISELNKTYAGGFQALKDVNLSIAEGEIFALLGPNGAGKTTLISSICGIVKPTSGSVTIDGFDSVREFRKARACIGLVPQELTTDAFETVFATVSYSRGLFGKSRNDKKVLEVLEILSLTDKKDKRLMTLSGGMKRRVMIAKALAHEPKILFLDEPTAGVDVELRKDMWLQIRKLRDAGVTVILTTHYISEAEDMADRIGIINRGELILTQKKAELIQQLGNKQLILELKEPLSALPKELSNSSLAIDAKGHQITYTYDSGLDDNGIAALLIALNRAGIHFRDLVTKQSSLEDIFVSLVRKS